MKNLFVLLCFSLCLISTSVSFASDGTETTKDCVIDNLDVVETPVIVGENVMSFTYVGVLGTVKTIPSVITMIAFSDNLVAEVIVIENRAESLFNVDYGLPSIQDFCSNTKTRVNNLAYKFVNKNCLTRQLIRC